MAKLSVLPKSQWATPEQVEETLAWLMQMKSDPGLKSLVVCGELSDGQVYYQSTRTDNVFQIAGLMMHVATELMKKEPQP